MFGVCCFTDPCQNGGSCIDEVGDYTCVCLSGFGGYHCEHDINECLSSPCVNGATCHDYVNSYTCECRPGFSGINCHSNDNDCSLRFADYDISFLNWMNNCILVVVRDVPLVCVHHLMYV